MTTNPDNQKPVEPSDVEAAAPTTFSAITQRWKREDSIKKASPITRGLALLFSILAFVIMVSNKHGPGRNFDEYEEYRFREGQDNIFTDSAASAITMAVLAFVSLALSALFSGYKLSTTHSFV
ncbi:hypothetical protein HID58_009981 [Brassica napus]|uniref:CASP-like protein n=1 Tax=Brassica napus TaxID=3708 RepID=A0ABQ8DU73_BRANA|nr:hypothetical protein HID58_009981 [Brassica napus]